MIVISKSKLRMLLVVIASAMAILFSASGSAQSALTFQPAVISTVAGTGIAGHTGDGGPATGATVAGGIKGIVTDAAGDVFFLDGSTSGTVSCTVRVIYEGGATAAALIAAEDNVSSPVVGNIYLIAGKEGSCGSSSQVALASSQSITTNTGGLGIDAAGDIYLAATSKTVWVVYAGGTNTAGTNLISLEAGVTSPVVGDMYRVAGSSSISTTTKGDGTLATSSSVYMNGIDDIKIDSAGNMYIVDQGDNAVRKVSATDGVISTLAGGGGTSSGASGKSTNGTPASSSLLNAPYSVALDETNNVYISDKNNNLVWMIYYGGNAAANLIRTETGLSPTVGDMYIVAGGGSKGLPYGVLASSSSLNGTTSIALDQAGNIYLAENGNRVVTTVSAATGTMMILAGTGTAGTPTGLDGDGGPATSALLNGLRGVAVDLEGNVYITDSGDNRVREVGPEGLLGFAGEAPGTTSSPKTIMLANAGNGTLTFQGFPSFSGANASDYSIDSSSPLNTCDFTVLAPNASCTMAVTYSPTGTSATSATINIPTDDSLGTHVLQLSAVAVPTTSTSLQASAQSVTQGSPVTFTASVSGGLTPTGAVNFYNGSTPIGTAMLSSQVATLTYTAPATGSLSVTAVYGGDSGNMGSTSNAVSVNVTGTTPSSTTLTPSTTATTQGQSVSVTAVVSGSGVTPTGQVSFSVAGGTVGTFTLSGGEAVFTTTVLPVGTDAIQALYLGDGTYAASTGATSVKISGVPTVTLAASSSTVNLGVPETLAATVTGSGVTPTGSVTFYNGSVILGTVALSAGKAAFTYTDTQDENDALTAVYSGDSNYIQATSASVIVTFYGRLFTHPGGLHTLADLDRMKNMVATGAHPWIDDWNLLVQDPNAQSTYTPKPLPNMGTSRQAADLDAHAAYLNAIRWYISGNTANANAAMNILNQWAAAVNQVPTGTDTPGLIAIPIQDFALAGEVLRLYPGWSATQFAAFQNMFTNYLYPVVNDFLTHHNGACISNYWANWDASNIGALLAMGVLNDNTNWFSQGVDYYQNGAGSGSIMHAVTTLYPGNIGQWQEAGRDQEHDQLGIGLLGYAAQTAWNQGVDLFGYSSNRLLAGAEYTAQYNTNQDVPFTPYNNCTNVQQYYPSQLERDRLDDRPVWELVYNHYHVLQGLSTPQSEHMAELIRPENGSKDHFGYGTLTFTLNASSSAYPPLPTPSAPTGVTATPAIGLAYVKWSTVPTANGYTVLRSTDGTNFTVLASLTQSTLTQYTDSAVTNGVTYYYQVEAANQSGTSAASSPVSATPVAGGTLPRGWSDADVGSVATPGNAGYAPASNNNFLVSGQGATIGGAADSFNFAYQKVTGDFTITARLASVTGAHLNHTGVMMREDLTAGGITAAMLVGSTGGRIAAMGWRTASGANMSWTTGNQYSYTPVWFRLHRAGNVFTASQSADGVTWFVVDSETVPMASTYYVGLVSSSGDTSTNTTETSNFDNVSPVFGAATSTISVQLNPAAPAYGQPVNIAASILPDSGTATPTGTVTFILDGQALAPVQLASGVATTTVPGTPGLGSHALTVSYSGDPTYAPAQATSNFTISPAATAVTNMAATRYHRSTATW